MDANHTPSDEELEIINDMTQRLTETYKRDIIWHSRETANGFPLHMIAGATIVGFIGNIIRGVNRGGGKDEAEMFFNLLINNLRNNFEGEKWRI